MCEHGTNSSPKDGRCRGVGGNPPLDRRQEGPSPRSKTRMSSGQQVQDSQSSQTPNSGQWATGFFDCCGTVNTPDNRLVGGVCLCLDQCFALQAQRGGLVDHVSQHARIRSGLRKRYGLPPDPCCFCCDEKDGAPGQEEYTDCCCPCDKAEFWVTCCCPVCAAVQEYKELMARGAVSATTLPTWTIKSLLKVVFCCSFPVVARAH